MYNILHMSDLHYGKNPSLEEERLNSLASWIIDRELSIKYVVFTGDMIDAFTIQEECIRRLKKDDPIFSENLKAIGKNIDIISCVRNTGDDCVKRYDELLRTITISRMEQAGKQFKCFLDRINVDSSHVVLCCGNHDRMRFAGIDDSAKCVDNSVIEEIMDAFPGETPGEIISEIKRAKKGSTILLESYTNMNLELAEMKKNQTDLDKKYSKKINYLTNENDQLLSEKKEDKEKYKKMVNDIKSKMDYNQNKIKENDYLRNTLYHIYNILFTQLNLVKDIVIDEKFIGLTEKDFNPDVLYDHEIINYIELMVKRMKNDSYDKMFRECVGYLNMIIRNYMPDKKKLRFRPDEIFREISNLIDLKMKSINEYKNVLKHNKILIDNMQLNINKLNEKYQNLSKEYESYKILVEKNIEKNNKDYFKNKEEKNKNLLKYINRNKTDNNINININIDDTNKKKKKELFNFNSEPNNKKKLNRNFSANKKRVLSSYKGNSIFNKYYYNAKNKSVKNIRSKNGNGFNSFDKQIFNLNEKKKMQKIFLNGNKLVKENGNQENINNFNRINNLIDETNRLFLYKPRMTSFQKKYKTIDNEEKNILETPDINTNIKNELFDKNLAKTLEGKIMKKLNDLITSSKMN